MQDELKMLQRKIGPHFCCRLMPEAASNLALIAHLPPDAWPEAGSITTIMADPAGLTIFEAES